MLHVEVAAVVNLAENAASKADVANNRCVDGSNLSCFGVDPYGGAGVSEQLSGGVAGMILGVRVELQFFEGAATASFAGEPSDLVGVQDAVDDPGATLLALALLGKDSEFTRIVRMNRHLQNTFPIVQLALIESGRNRRAVRSEQEF